ncbi:MAG: hypothetical protein WBA28_03190 [Microbacteriaceae bacterium]
MTLGDVSAAQRAAAANMFTVEDSVDKLLAILARPRPITPAEIIEQLETVVSLPSARDQTISALGMEPLRGPLKTPLKAHKPSNLTPKYHQLHKLFKKRENSHGRQIPQKTIFEEGRKVPERETG